MNQTCEFGRFYYVIATKEVVRCVASAPREDGHYWFAISASGGSAYCYLPSEVALIPHMTSWDCELPKHPEEGWRFLGEDETPQKGDEYWSAYRKEWILSCIPNPEVVYRRRIEPDHVAILLAYGMSSEANESRKAVIAELLALREQVKGGDACS